MHFSVISEIDYACFAKSRLEAWSALAGRRDKKMTAVTTRVCGVTWFHGEGNCSIVCIEYLLYIHMIQSSSSRRNLFMKMRCSHFWNSEIVDVLTGFPKLGRTKMAVAKIQKRQLVAERRTWTRSRPFLVHTVRYCRQSLSNRHRPLSSLKRRNGTER